ncbi:bifunctional ADP-dependent NAD(P)H-hydrate dehydratase/NAD(P)H-hydrate epimerase [Crocinitomix catalasitica]|uniref:bifunctional ADP-dependent NAD(P)H-hydrate dehydratase/NAD(P)H-hydrate epimerase n=1 Tax=Crocinitomix catalasitica TaxID=184607 RepID=UPI0004809020|nr:bifunctional ADP-dependent NAD(P)H-hydrate dehydratase/NAD(P)H-hydrate epimerase [Crocinitomix catalasitica]
MEHFKKILNVSQIRSADQYSIQNKWQTSIALMENAAIALVKALEKRDIAAKNIVIICGTGNNGGDGFAVCRLLRNRGIAAKAILVQFSDKLSKDCEINKNKLKDVIVIDSTSQLPDLSHYDVIIDAIFGSGLNKPIRGLAATIIETINNSGKTIYSIDVPSGVLCDEISTGEHIIKSSHVTSFQRPKRSFFFPENAPYIKTWEVVDIGLIESFIQSQNSTAYILDQHILTYVQSRPRQSHKGTYGHALLMAGAYGKMGAAVLSAKACLRSGVGLLTTFNPKCGYNIMQISVPESMCITDENEAYLSSLPEIENYSAVGIGPGIGQEESTQKLFKKLLKKSKQPIVIDADAINIMATNNDLIPLLPHNTILTPHIKEFDRLVGNSIDSIERHKKQQEFSIKNKCIVVLKDANTCISSPTGDLYYNTSGNQGMATGGSGDVLTGIITGLLAQHYAPLHAALIGVYFHGKAGDSAVKTKGYNALIASDIIAHLKIENLEDRI